VISDDVDGANDERTSSNVHHSLHWCILPRFT